MATKATNKTIPLRVVENSAKIAVNRQVAKGRDKLRNLLAFVLLAAVETKMLSDEQRFR